MSTPDLSEYRLELGAEFSGRELGSPGFQAYTININYNNYTVN
jgi:hypothetical protein